MKTIEIDLETRSDRDITKCGVYAYADSPYFAITLMSVSVDDGAVQLYDLANGDRVPEDILTALADENRSSSGRSTCNLNVYVSPNICVRNIRSSSAATASMRTRSAIISVRSAGSVP